MPLIASAEQARMNRRRGQAADGVTFWHTLYLGTTRYNMAPGAPEPEPGKLFPMAFLVEQDPGSTAHAHFHQADQFQVIVGGCARFGVHDVKPVTVHYAGAYTAYGPIRASGGGVHYFTLRNAFDPGARFMARAENRAALRGMPNRRHREAVVGPIDCSAIAALTAPGVSELVPGEPDGLAIWRYSLQPSESVRGPDPSTGNGQYWLVLDGGIQVGARAFTSRSCGFLFPDEPAFMASAGPEGASLLAMQFPARPSDQGLGSMTAGKSRGSASIR